MYGVGTFHGSQGRDHEEGHWTRDRWPILQPYLHVRFQNEDRYEVVDTVG